MGFIIFTYDQSITIIGRLWVIGTDLDGTANCVSWVLVL